MLPGIIVAAIALTGQCPLSSPEGQVLWTEERPGQDRELSVASDTGPVVDG